MTNQPTAVTLLPDLVALIEAKLPEVHISISDGHYRHAAEQIAEALTRSPQPPSSDTRLREALEPFARAAGKGQAVYDGVKALLKDQPHLSTYSTAYIDAGRSTASAQLSWADYERAAAALQDTASPTNAGEGK